MNLDKHKLRRWFVEQKYTLQRGYGNLNVLMLGIVAAASIKGAFPALINSMTKFVLLSIFGFAILFIVGYFDKKWRVLDEENNYATEKSPLLMELVHAVRAEKENKDEKKIME